MELDPQSFFSSLTETLQRPETGHDDCLNLLKCFNRSLIEEQIDSALLDLYLPHFFYTSNSLLNFVEKSSKIKKFKEACVIGVEILYTIVNNCYDRVNDKDVLLLYTVVSKIIKLPIDSNIKKKVFALVFKSLEKSDGCIDNSAIQDLYKSLVFSLQQKHSDTVKGKELELLGYLSKKYSFTINNNQVKRIFWTNFDKNFTLRTTSTNIISGFYTGFGYFLETFPITFDVIEDKKYMEKLYKHLKILVVLSSSVRIKSGNRDGLTFFATHNSYFKEDLIKDYEFWHKQLLNWFLFGLEEKKVAVIALRAFYQTIAKVMEDNNNKEIIQYFILHCKIILETKNPTNYEKHLAIYCLREFSSASHKHLDPKEVTDIFLIIMQSFENIFYDTQNEDSEYLPDYIQTVANFMKFKEFTNSQLFCLQKGVITMIKSFHQLEYLHHGLVIDSVLLTLFYLKKTKYFDSFLENIIYQGVVWSCSHQHSTIEISSVITVKNYYPLWRGILKLSSNPNFDKYEFYFEDRNFLLQKIISELIKTFMILINKLNVTISIKDDNISELEKSYKVEKVNDYAIFLNVVDFYKDIFNNIEPKIYMIKIINHLITKCLKYPLISGFYKLLSYCLKISKNLSTDDYLENLTSFLTILLNKMSEFKDDLLISCLQVLLETPVEAIQPILPYCVIPFTNIFELGRSYLPLAETGIDTLEYWQLNLKPEILDPFLSKIIPNLDTFLRSKFLKGYTIQTIEKKRKTLQALKKRKITEEIEPELIKLQRKILCFIGRQSLKNCQNFIFSDSYFVANLNGGQSSHLKLTLPYDDLQLDIYLDPFLPRIVELALYSSDRKTRIMSCELLQACVMVFLGRAKQMSSTGLDEMNNKLKILAMPLLQLSCDVDQVVRQIFEPLFLQLIHWYTSPTQTKSAHASIIIETLLEGISHPTNSNLKDFSGKCVNEFIKWTLKHKNLNPESNLKVFVKHMRFFSTHPDSAKKLGAALIFNNIYREIREHDKIISIFWLEILHIFVLSLNLIIDLEESNTVLQIKRCLVHIQRVIIEKFLIFRKLDKKRRIPKDLNNGLLTDLSIFLLNQTSSNSKHCREICMELFINLAPLASTKELNLQEFIIEYLDTTVSSLYDSKIQKSENLFDYLHNLLCCLDGYEFIIKNNLEIVNFDEIIFVEVQKFLKKKLTFTSLDINLKIANACYLSILKLYNEIIDNEKLLDENFWELIINIIFYPQDLGINIIYDEYKNIIPKNINLLQHTINNYKISIIDIEKNVSLKDRNFLKGLILLNTTSELPDKILENFIINFHKKSIEGIIYINQIPDTTFNYLSMLFKIVNNLDKLLFSNYYIQTIDNIKKQHIGYFFVTTFPESIVPIIIKNFDQFFKNNISENTLQIIIFILKYSNSKDLTNILLLYWNDFVEFFNINDETMDQGLEYLSLFVQICDYGSPDMQNWLVDCLIRNRSNNFVIFGLLVKVTKNVTENQSNDLKTAYTILNETLFNISKQEVISSNVNKLLQFLPVVQSLHIFEYLMSTYIRITPSINIYDLLNKFIIQINKNQQMEFLEKSYKMVNIKIATDILLPIFQNCELEIIEQFFIEYIQKMLNEFNNLNLESSIINFIILEIVFLRIPERINLPDKPKLLQDLLKHALDAFKIDQKQNELTRKYKCHAYNALASMISNCITKNKINLYEKLFIRQSLNNADILWNGIVNIEIKYDFPRLFESLPKRKKILVNIRHELRHKINTDKKTLEYIESQRLFNSSLSEDVTKFDFTNTILRTDNEAKISYKPVQSEIYLDMTEINNHECMGTICSIIEHIFDTEIFDEDVLPNWMDGIRKVLLDGTTHRNVKIFLVKVIDNEIGIFNRYAKFFLEPLIQFVVDKIAGDTINYFVTDVLVIISKWSTEIPDLSITESSLASKLLEHFIKTLELDRQDVFKYNIELLKLIVESWKHCLIPPVNTIFELLSNDKTSEIAIYVCSVLLVNNLEVWQRGCEYAFLNLMLKHLETSSMRVYRICSETLGLLLVKLKAEEFVDIVNLKLNAMVDNSKFVTCLEGITIKYPKIVNMYHIARLVSRFNQVPSTEKITHLKIIHRRLEMSLDILQDISEFRIMEWHKYIDDSDLQIQILSLEIIKKCIFIFSTYPNFPKIIISLKNNIYHPNIIFRSCLYDAAISIYNLNKNVDCKEILIFGLVDPDLDNKNKCINFWSLDLPKMAIEKCSYLLSEMYKSKIEDKFLGLSTYFLLLNISDFEIFEHPLEDCNFEEYKLETNWKLQHPSVVPMFAETLDINTIESSPDTITDDVFILRNSQSNLEFAPTQEQQLSKYTSLDSTLGVDLEFKNPNTVTLSQKYKRFLSDKSKISRNMALYETQKKINKSRERVEAAIEREKKVTIYRSYRKGDLPDVQISLSAILKPLQMLALHDNEISKILFLEIFKGLSSKIENNQNFLNIVSDAIKNIFKTSIQFNRHLFSALLDILIKNKESIKFDPNLVAHVALESDLAAVGALLIEEYINLGVEECGLSKRNYGENNYENIFWIKLAELYKNLEEWDIVRSIFLEKMEYKQSIQEALTFESKLMYREAQDIYRDLIETDLSQIRKDFYYESYFKCFANLGQWEKIPETIESVVENDNLWEDDWCKQKLLPWYIKSNVKTQLFTTEINQHFFNDLNKCLIDPKRSQYLVSNFSEDLCVLWLCQKDLITANQYLKICIKNFLDDWQILNPMFQSQRYQKLLKLQNIIEIADFTKIFNNDESFKILTEKWSANNDPPPSVLFSETKLLYRKQFINIILDKLLKIKDADLNVQIKNMQVAKVRMDVDLINTAAEFGHFFITRKYLRPYENKDNGELNLAKGTLMILKAKMTADSSLKMKFLLDALGRFLQITGDSLSLKSTNKSFDVLIEISQLSSENIDLLTENKQKMSTYTNQIMNLPSDINKYAYNLLKNITGNCIVEEMDTDSNITTKTITKIKDLSNTYIKLAYFIRDEQDENLQGDFITFILRAMKLNSVEARQVFPCILMLNNLSTIHKNIFINEVENIPTWMFLGWIPQLLANVDSDKIFAISKIILRIAENYPQAIMYPYRLSKENYNFNDNNIAHEAKVLTERLDDLLLKDEKINKFLKALSFVSIPACILKYYNDKIKKSTNIENVTKIVENVLKEIFQQITRTEDVANLQGNAFVKIQKFKEDFEKFLAEDITIPEIHNLYTKLKDKLDNVIKNLEPSYLLKDYSPWLANFSANKLNMELEIPGQYDGKKLPLTQHHVKLSGFYPEIKIMASLRKPIKITMLATNTKEYPFLLKFGEDIRQDQRIEQLFCLVNEFLRNDHSCSSSGLDILTYQVIPLTSNLGLIQWLNDTLPMKDFIKKSLKNQREIKQFEDELGKEYNKNLKIKNQNNYLHIYGNAAETIKKDKVVINFMTLVKKVHRDILRSSLHTLSTTTENYIALRNNFIKTYSVICATHWILGIGDRHLTNSLICLRNGKVLGVDFGYSFGTATQILPVPELVPFRLTPHILNLMEPLKERGPFREYMIHCLRCLRANSLPLIATMNVFIQEPSIDWLEHSEMIDDSEVSRTDSWYPVIKIEQAKRKLKGANSVDIMKEELNAGCRVENFTEAYIKHVNGENGVNFRTDFVGLTDLDVDKQVDCLIDHATDYNLLGRMFAGWEPWV